MSDEGYQVEIDKLLSRVTELETQHAAAIDYWLLKCNERVAEADAANSRADAAERESERWETCATDLHSEAADLRDGLQASISANARLETEAASLRAELDNANAKYADARDRCIAAQDEVGKLRAEVERKEKTAAAYHVAESRLSTATELLRECHSRQLLLPHALHDRLAAFLSTAPAPTERHPMAGTELNHHDAPTEREAAERKVLEDK